MQEIIARRQADASSLPNPLRCSAPVLPCAAADPGHSGGLRGHRQGSVAAPESMVPHVGVSTTESCHSVGVCGDNVVDVTPGVMLVT